MGIREHENPKFLRRSPRSFAHLEIESLDGLEISLGDASLEQHFHQLEEFDTMDKAAKTLDFESKKAQSEERSRGEIGWWPRFRGLRRNQSRRPQTVQPRDFPLGVPGLPYKAV